MLDESILPSGDHFHQGNALLGVRPSHSGEGHGCEFHTMTATLSKNITDFHL